MNEYSVWVGGVEVNAYYLTKEQAESVSQGYLDEGYDDVVITRTEAVE
jgi:hypothetical protein